MAEQEQNIPPNIPEYTQMYEQRISICEKCEHFQRGLARCKICGCFMAIKARIPRAHCPIKYWPGDIDENQA